MEIIKIQKINDTLKNQLLQIWENSVKTTHYFLSDLEIQKIKKYVPIVLEEVSHLFILKEKVPLGFMGISGKRLEMLFIDHNHQNQGLGKKLLQYGIDHYSINEVTVNEQNNKATLFYKHMGFHVYKRTEFDEQGNSFPLLYMKL